MAVTNQSPIDSLQWCCEWLLGRLQHLQAELQNLELRICRVSWGLAHCFQRLLVQVAQNQIECEK